MSNATEKIMESRVRITIKHPWWSALVLKLAPVELTAADMARHGLPPTAATDGQRIIYCKEFVESLPNDQLDGLLIHEALHCGFLHHARMQGRDPEKWNYATDHAINLIALEDGVALPEGGLHDSKYAGMSGEEIYELIPDPPKMPRWGCVIAGQGSGDGDDGEEDGGYGKITDAEWQNTMVEALHQALQQGRLQSTAERILGELLKPDPINWQVLLSELVMKIYGQYDYSWRRPNRRALGLDYIMPSMFAEVCKPIAFCIDSSGSMGADEISKGISNIRNCISQVTPIETIIIVCDAEVSSIHELSQYDEFTMPSIKGGGGTDFRPAIKAAVDKEVACIVYFTDLYGSFGSEPDVPVIWVTDNKSDSPPFGEKVVT